jgi:hypothetical protein
VSRTGRASSPNGTARREAEKPKGNGMKYCTARLTIIASLGVLGLLGCGGGSAADQTNLGSDSSELAKGAGAAPSNHREEDDIDDVDEEDGIDDLDEVEDGDDLDQDDEEEDDDRIVCAVDADCDSDEVCTNGLCSDPPGKADDEDAVCEGEDDKEEDDDEDEDENDRVVCAVNTDCDSDEVCTTGLCSDSSR